MRKRRFPLIFGNLLRSWFGVGLDPCGISGMPQSCCSQPQLGCWVLFCGVLRVLSLSWFCSFKEGCQIRELILASLSVNPNQETRSKLRASHPLVQSDVMLRASHPLVQFRPRPVISALEQYFFLNPLSIAMLFYRNVIKSILTRTGVHSLMVPRTVKCISFPFSQRTPVFLMNELL